MSKQYTVKTKTNTSVQVSYVGIGYKTPLFEMIVTRIGDTIRIVGGREETGHLEIRPGEEVDAFIEALQRANQEAFTHQRKFIEGVPDGE